MWMSPVVIVDARPGFAGLGRRAAGQRVRVEALRMAAAREIFGTEPEAGEQARRARRELAGKDEDSERIVRRLGLGCPA